MKDFAYAPSGATASAGNRASASARSVATQTSAAASSMSPILRCSGRLTNVMRASTFAAHSLANRHASSGPNAFILHDTHVHFPSLTAKTPNVPGSPARTAFLYFTRLTSVGSHECLEGCARPNSFNRQSMYSGCMLANPHERTRTRANTRTREHTNKQKTNKQTTRTLRDAATLDHDRCARCSRVRTDPRNSKTPCTSRGDVCGRRLVARRRPCDVRTHRQSATPTHHIADKCP